MPLSLSIENLGVFDLESLPKIHHIAVQPHAKTTALSRYIRFCTHRSQVRREWPKGAFQAEFEGFFDVLLRISIHDQDEFNDASCEAIGVIFVELRSISI
jgi:hypothetical protein